MLLFACVVSLALAQATVWTSVFLDEFKNLSQWQFKTSRAMDDKLPFASGGAISSCAGVDCVMFNMTRGCGDIFTRQSFTPGVSGRFRLDWSFFGVSNLCGEKAGLGLWTYTCGDMILATTKVNDPDCTRNGSQLASSTMTLCPSEPNCYKAGGFYAAQASNVIVPYSTIFQPEPSNAAIKLGIHQFGGSPMSFGIARMQLYIEVDVTPIPSPKATITTSTTTAMTATSPSTTTTTTTTATGPTLPPASASVGTITLAPFPAEPDNAALIAGVVGGTIGALLLAAAVVVFLVRRRSQQSSGSPERGTRYGSLPKSLVARYDDAPDVRSAAAYGDTHDVREAAKS